MVSCSPGYRDGDVDATRATPGEKDGGGLTRAASPGNVMGGHLLLCADLKLFLLIDRPHRLVDEVARGVIEQVGCGFTEVLLGESQVNRFGLISTDTGDNKNRATVAVNWLSTITF